MITTSNRSYNLAKEVKGIRDERPDWFDSIQVCAECKNVPSVFDLNTACTSNIDVLRSEKFLQHIGPLVDVEIWRGPNFTTPEAYTDLSWLAQQIAHEKKYYRVVVELTYSGKWKVDLGGTTSERLQPFMALLKVCEDVMHVNREYK